MNQLASAFEQQLLTKGDSVRLVVGGGEVTIKLVVTNASDQGSDGGIEVGQVGCSLNRTESLF